MRTKGRLLPAKNSGTNAGAGMRSHTPPTLAALQAKADAHVARQGPPIQAKFAADTTFGLEIEFKNRWISPYALEKSVPGMPLEGALAGWTAESDAGRLYPAEGEMERGTVLEVETKPYTGDKMKDGTVSAHIQELYDTSATIAETSAARGAITGLEADADNYPLDPPREKALREAMTTDHGEEAEATLQITTLGKRTPEHLEALSDAADSFDTKNIDILGRGGGELPDWAMKLSVARLIASTEASVLRENATALSSGAPDARARARLVFEDFEATLTPLVQIINLAEQGLKGGWGTIKNLIAPVLPRRVIRPPAIGYAAALGIDASYYRSKLDGYLTRIRAFDDSGIDEVVFDLWSQLAKGAVDGGRKIDEADNTLTQYLAFLLHEAIKRDATKPPGERHGVSLLHTIAGSEPTLEDKIIAGAGKNPAEGWTSHEIRNALYAQAMTASQMKEYIDQLKRFT